MITYNTQVMKIMLDEGARMPKKAHATDVGYDIFSPIDVFAAMIGGYVFSENKKMVDFDLAQTYMDDKIQEELHERMNSYDEQDFFSAYEKEHYKKFGESFVKTYNLEHNAY